MASNKLPIADIDHSAKPPWSVPPSDHRDWSLDLQWLIEGTTYKLLFGGISRWQKASQILIQLTRSHLVSPPLRTRGYTRRFLFRVAMPFPSCGRENCKLNCISHGHRKPLAHKHDHAGRPTLGPAANTRHVPHTKVPSGCAQGPQKNSRKGRRKAPKNANPTPTLSSGTASAAQRPPATKTKAPKKQQAPAGPLPPPAAAAAPSDTASHHRSSVRCADAPQLPHAAKGSAA